MASSRNTRKRRDAVARYTVDDLAERTDLTPRTIRAYQTQGLLQAPERYGRVAYYDDAHLERLAEIALLKERGLSLTTIHGVLRRRDIESRVRAKSDPEVDASPTTQQTGSTTGAAVDPPAPSPPPPVTARGAPVASPRPATLAADSADAKAGPPEPARRRLGLAALLILGLLLVVAAVSSVIAVLILRDADDDRERLGRQVSELQGDLSRLDGNESPPSTVLVPVPQPAPPRSTSPTTSAPASAPRTVIVRAPSSPTTARPVSPPVTTAPAAPPTTQNCTVKLLNVCL